MTIVSVRSTSDFEPTGTSRSACDSAPKERLCTSSTVSPPPAVQLRDVSKQYGLHQAVASVSLDIHRGEFVTLLGPSGSGKTTTLLMIAGHEIPDRGSITIAGQDVTHVPAHQREIGMVFQHYALFPHLSVAQNVAFPLRMRRMPSAEIRASVKSMLSLVRLDGLGDRHPRQLSGGQRQRVALARALVFKPSILLMDEPLSALDKKLREEMQAEIKRIQSGLGITTVYVTHDQHEALVLSDRIAVFNAGRIEQIGTPGEIYDRPRTRFVAGFLGETTFLPGRVADEVDDVCAVRVSDGLILKGCPADAVQPGQKVVLGVRPESIILGRLPGDDLNRVEAVVEQIEYYGEGRRVTARTPCGCVLHAKQQNSGIDQGHEPGDTVVLSWKWSKTTIMTEEVHEGV